LCKHPHPGGHLWLQQYKYHHFKDTRASEHISTRPNVHWQLHQSKYLDHKDTRALEPISTRPNGRVGLPNRNYHHPKDIHCCEATSRYPNGHSAHPCSRAHTKTSKWPFSAANWGHLLCFIRLLIFAAISNLSSWGHCSAFFVWILA
jgi:hypothetical protein